MENRTKIFIKMGVVFIVIFLVAPTAITLASPPQQAYFSSIQQTMNPSSQSKGEIELKYYNEDCLDIILGLERDTWKTAIRLTQDEMAAYSDWTLTKVNVAFNADHGCSVADIRIFLYDKGNDTHPGNLIDDNTIFSLNTTGITIVPLVTSINLSDYEELWVAVEWTPVDTQGVGIYYAWLDTLSGPHVPNKSDFVYHDSWGWIQLHLSAPWFDGRWGIGAIIKGPRPTELTIGSIDGPVGITAIVSNIGVIDAINVSWTIAVTGGLLHRINSTAIGTSSLLAVDFSLEISIDKIFGFGKIKIIVTAEAENALQIAETRRAFLLGPFIVGIKDNF